MAIIEHPDVRCACWKHRDAPRPAAGFVRAFTDPDIWWPRCAKSIEDLRIDPDPIPHVVAYLHDPAADHDAPAATPDRDHHDRS